MILAMAVSLLRGLAASGEGATTVSLVSAGLFALVLAYSLLRTSSLWFAFGFHAAWNFMQSFIFGLANSGGVSPQALVTSTLNGPPLLTGGTAGPEGSLLCPLAIAVLVAVVQFVVPPDLLSTRPAAIKALTFTNHSRTSATYPISAISTKCCQALEAAVNRLAIYRQNWAAC